MSPATTQDTHHSIHTILAGDIRTNNILHKGQQLGVTAQVLGELLQELYHLERIRNVLGELVESDADLLVPLLILWSSVELYQFCNMAPHCQLVFLKLYKSFGGVFINSSEQVEELFHAVLWW